MRLCRGQASADRVYCPPPPALIPPHPFSSSSFPSLRPQAYRPCPAPCPPPPPADPASPQLQRGGEQAGREHGGGDTQAGRAGTELRTAGERGDPRRGPRVRHAWVRGRHQVRLGIKLGIKSRLGIKSG